MNTSIEVIDCVVRGVYCTRLERVIIHLVVQKIMGVTIWEVQVHRTRTPGPWEWTSEKYLCVRARSLFIPTVPMFSSVVGANTYIHVLSNPKTHSVRVLALST